MNASDLQRLRAELAELQARMTALDTALEQEQRLLAILDKEFPVDPSWASGSKAGIRATIESLTAERTRLNVRGVEIAASLPVAVRPMERPSFVKSNR